MTPSWDVEAGLALIRKARGMRTLYLVRRPTADRPELTLDVPCGSTRYVRLGRWPIDCLPTRRELADDILRARQTLGGAGRRVAA